MSFINVEVTKSTPTLSIENDKRLYGAGSSRHENEDEV